MFYVLDDLEPRDPLLLPLWTAIFNAMTTNSHQSIDFYFESPTSPALLTEATTESLSLENAIRVRPVVYCVHLATNFLREMTPQVLGVVADDHQRPHQPPWLNVYPSMTMLYFLNEAWYVLSV